MRSSHIKSLESFPNSYRPTDFAEEPFLGVVWVFFLKKWAPRRNLWVKSAKIPVFKPLSLGSYPSPLQSHKPPYRVGIKSSQIDQNEAMS